MKSMKGCVVEILKLKCKTLMLSAKKSEGQVNLTWTVQNGQLDGHWSNKLKELRVL